MCGVQNTTHVLDTKVSTSLSLSLSLSNTTTPTKKEEEEEETHNKNRQNYCENNTHPSFFFFFYSFFFWEETKSFPLCRTKAQNKRHTHAQNKTKQNKKIRTKKDALCYSTEHKGQVKCSLLGRKKERALSRTNKRASLVGALWCCVLPRWRDDSSSPLRSR